MGRADVQADRLALSGRGGLLDSTATWNSDLPVAAWRHLTTLGRDQYVKVVEKGYLFPFGHRVSQVTVTERQFEAQGGEIVAAERQIVFLVVRGPTLSYAPADTFGIAYNSRDFPFRSLTLKTLRTPDLDLPVNFLAGYTNGFSETPYIPTVGGVPFSWHFVGIDWAGRAIPFTAQCIYVGIEDAISPAIQTMIGAYHNLDPADPTRVADFHGRTVAFAESLVTGDTDFQVTSMTFGASGGADPTFSVSDDEFRAHDQPRFYPSLAPLTIDPFAAPGTLGNYGVTGSQAVVRTGYRGERSATGSTRCPHRNASTDCSIRT